MNICYVVYIIFLDEIKLEENKRRENSLQHLCTACSFGNIADFQWPEHTWDYENNFQLRVVPANQSKFLYRDPKMSSSWAGLTSYQGPNN